MAKIIRVGVFDSGIGGLSVLNACQKIAPYMRYYYYGDNEFAPYGSRTKREISERVEGAMERFLKLRADVVILACNTATALCIDEVRRKYPMPVIGTEPAVLPAARVCKNALLLATSRTIESDRLRRLVERAQGCDFTLFAPPRLVSAIERYAADGVPVELKEHLPQGTYDGVVLGCTHYVHLKREISTFYHADVYDGGEGVAHELLRVLGRDGQPLVGIDDHHFEKNDRSCEAGEKWENDTKYGVFFLGKAQDINKFAYKRLFLS